jgi:hypothetical protein
LRLDAGHLLLVYKTYDTSLVQSRVIDLAKLGKGKDELRDGPAAGSEKADLAKANIEVRSVVRRQLYVDGKPVGDPFE